MQAQGTETFDILFDHVFDLGVPGGQTMLQDNDGFLWLGSEGGGLFRWNGYTLKNYAAGESGLSSNMLFRIVADPRDPDIFWIGTANGLNRFDKATETFTVYYHDPGNPSSISDNTVQDIVQDGQNPDILWLATTNGLNKFDKTAQTFTRYEPNPLLPHSLSYPDIWRMIEDVADPNVLWIGTYGGGLDKFDKRSASFTHYVHDPNNPNSLGDPDNLIDALVQDKNNPAILWIGSSSNGMDRFDTQTETFTHYPAELTHGEVGLIYDDGHGTLWLGGYVTDNGLTLFDKSTETFTHYVNDPNEPRSLASNLVVNVFEDRSGIFWIVSYAGKVDKIDRYTQNFTLYRHNPQVPTSLSDNAVTTLYEDRAGIIWVGTQAGLNRFDPTTGSFTPYQANAEDPTTLDVGYILGTYEDSAGDFWVSLWTGPLVKFNRETGQVVARFPAETDGFTGIIEDPDDPNILWLGTLVAGFAKFDKKNEQFTFYKQDTLNPTRGPSTGYIYTILYDRQEKIIWMGGRYGGGLNKFDIRTETFTHYKSVPDDPQSLGADVIASIYQDADGVIWVGTQGGGLNKFDKQTATFTRYGQAHNIPMDVNAILEDDTGDLWLATNKGIIRFNPHTATVEKHYTQSDGLQGDIFLAGSGLKTRNGELWFGGTNGLTRFDPAALVSNPYVPPVVLTALTQGGTQVDWNKGKIPARLDEITLDWRHNFFEFEFVVLNYTHPEKNQYAYKLEGVDEDWRYSGTRNFGNYTTLPPGKYTLRLKGANNDGVWNEEGASLRITVLPPFWRTWWFISAVVVLVIGGIATNVALRFRAIERQRRILETQVNERTATLSRYTEAMVQLNRIGQRLTATLNLDEIAEQLAQVGPKIVDSESLSVWLLNEKNAAELMCWTASYSGGDGNKTPVNMCISADQGIAGWVLRTGQSTVVPDVTTDPRHFMGISREIEFPVHSLLAVPLKIRNTTIGVLEMVNKREGTFTDRDLALTETLAASIAIAIDNARLVRTLREHATELETQNAELDAFAHTVAHDLKNPLAALVGFSTLLTTRYEKFPAEKSDEILQRITQIGYKMTNIINELLLLASVRKMADVKTGPLDMQSIVREVLTRMADLATEFHATFTLPDAWPTAVGYAPWVEEVWANYISNAIKYGGQPEKGIPPHVELGYTVPAAGSAVPEITDTPVSLPAPDIRQPASGIRFWVRDNGYGLTVEEQATLFTEFTRLEQTRAEGHGLGLSIVQRIVKKLGGEVGVESKIGQGSTFWFSLPGT